MAVNVAGLLYCLLGVKYFICTEVFYGSKDRLERSPAVLD